MIATAAGVSEGYYDRLAASLERDGYCLLSEGLSEGMLEALYRRAGPESALDFRRAGVGRDDNFRLSTKLRSDHIHWLGHGSAAESSYLKWMETLRLELNRRLFLGLFDYECHFARYAPGGFYKKHRDAFVGDSNRILSTVLYLNPGWQAEWGGELLMYDDLNDDVVARILPKYGNLLLFFSERFPHEVCSALHDRYSVAGWFRVSQSPLR
jgi:SM-20-related protein